MSVNVAVIGCGYWGPNLIRALSQNPSARVHTLCDSRRETLGPLAQQYAKDAALETDYRRVAADAHIAAVAIATPAATHFEIAREFLRAGKHVLVEKPLALTSADCRELIGLARRAQLVLMAGHVFIYNSAVNKAKEYIDSGELGDILYIWSQRLNLGRIQNDLNCLWSFAPHDVSIICHWLGERPVKVAAVGFSCLGRDVADVVFATLHFPSGVAAHVHMSWLDPRKVRGCTIVGSKKMLVYDDVSTEARLQIYDKGVTTGEPFGASKSLGEFQLQIRSGDLLVPVFKFTEPLANEVQDFLQCIAKGTRPRADGESGLEVVEVIEALDRSLHSGGMPVEVAAAAARENTAPASGFAEEERVRPSTTHPLLTPAKP